VAELVAHHQDQTRQIENEVSADVIRSKVLLTFCYSLRVLPIYEFINDDRVKRDIKKAMSDYASDLLKSPKTGAVSLTPKKNFAHYNEGARVEWTSSVSEKCRKKKVFIFWSKTVCEDRTNHQNLIKPTNSEPDSEWFMFGNNVRRVK
jgi:hypothetical protein